MIVDESAFSRYQIVLRVLHSYINIVFLCHYIMLEKNVYSDIFGVR